MAFLLGTWPLPSFTSIFTSAANLRGLVFPSWNIFKHKPEYISLLGEAFLSVLQLLDRFQPSLRGSWAPDGHTVLPFLHPSPRASPGRVPSPCTAVEWCPIPSFTPCAPSSSLLCSRGISPSTSRLDPCALFSKDALVSSLGLVCFPRTSHSFCPSR